MLFRSFSSNRVAYPGGNDVVLRQIRAGFRLAGRTAEAYGAHVFADIGPVTGLDEVRTKEEYRYIIERWMYDSSYSIGDITDWLNKNHFDYRGLIEKGLAIDATGLDIY